MRFDKFPLERQLDIMDCGPACLKMVAKFYGKYYTLQYLRELCGNTREGVSLAGISHGAEAIGLKTLAAHCTVADLCNKAPLPAIIHWENSHFVVLYDVRKKNGQLEFYIADPAKGLLRLSEQSFAERWLSSTDSSDLGVTLLLECRGDFKQRSEERRSERGKTLENFLGYFRPYRKNIAYLLLGMLLITAMQGLLPFVSKAVIDIGIQTQDAEFINVVLIANLTLLVAIAISSLARDWILQHISSRLNIALISDYLIKLMSLPVSFFENKMVGDILQRANDHERIRSFIVNNSLNLVFSTLTFAVFSVIMYYYNPNIFYIFIGGSFLYVLWVFAFISFRKKLDWDYFELTAKNQSYWVETIGAIQDIKVNNIEKVKRWKWEYIQAKLFKVNNRLLTINNVQTLGASFIDSVKNLLIVVYCAKAVIAGSITFGVMISSQFIIGMLNGPVQQMINFIIQFQGAQLSFKRLNEIQVLNEEDDDSGTDDFNFVKDKTIQVINLSFRYSPVAPIILKNISLTIPQGKVTAIVGDSGSGKSTLLKLLLRLYKPSMGEVLIGGLNINNINLFQWRSKCGAVLQDGKIFDDTVLKNIVLDDERIDQEALISAVKTANIDFEIQQLPLGYKTRIGENGRKLSGGQKQRVLIARALYRCPELLFFDEATNALDAINEQKITNSLNNIFEGKTVVVVAHRLSTVRKADQIIVMKDGSIVEAGNHEYLMALGGNYAKLVGLQTEKYLIES